MDSIMHSEAGLMLMAEEFDMLRSKRVLRVLLLISEHGPLTRREIIKSRIGRPYRTKQILDFLIDQGILVKVKQSYSARPRMPPKNFTRYFLADEFIGEAISETMSLLQRSHQAYADGFERLRNDLKPTV